jgi:hypothetical protein
VWYSFKFFPLLSTSSYIDSYQIKGIALRISDGCFDGRLFSALSLSALSVPGVDPGVDTGVDTTVY